MLVYTSDLNYLCYSKYKESLPDRDYEPNILDHKWCVNGMNYEKNYVIGRVCMGMTCKMVLKPEHSRKYK